VSLAVESWPRMDTRVPPSRLAQYALPASPPLAGAVRSGGNQPPSGGSSGPVSSPVSRLECRPEGRFRVVGQLLLISVSPGCGAFGVTLIVPRGSAAKKILRADHKKSVISIEGH
jgi:hypothetical protein